MSEKETRVYEVGLLMAPSVLEEDAPQELEKIKSLLAEAGAEVIATGGPEFIDLSYPMEQVVGGAKTIYRQAHFAWCKFAVEPSELQKIEKILESHRAIIRHLLIKTSRDNTVEFKKPKEKVRRHSAEEQLETEPAETKEDAESIDAHERLPELVESGETVSEEGIVVSAPLEGSEEVGQPPEEA